MELNNGHFHVCWEMEVCQFPRSSPGPLRPARAPAAEPRATRGALWELEDV